MVVVSYQKGAAMQFEFEEQAMSGFPIPDGLKQWEQNAYIALRGLYQQYRLGVIDRETATADKRMIVKAAQEAESLEAFRRKLAQSTAMLWKEIEAAGSMYAKVPTLENADAFYQAVYHVKRKTGVDKIL